VRPSTVASAYAAFAGAAAVAGFEAGLLWRLTLTVSVACVLVGLGRAGLMLLNTAQRRRTADRLLGTGVKVHPQSELLTWRAAELTSARNRSMLARSLRGLVQEVDRAERAIADFASRSGGRARVHTGGGLR
jgi:hypothetical protein